VILFTTLKHIQAGFTTLSLYRTASPKYCTSDQEKVRQSLVQSASDQNNRKGHTSSYETGPRHWGFPTFSIQ